MEIKSSRLLYRRSGHRLLSSSIILLSFLFFIVSTAGCFQPVVPLAVQAQSAVSPNIVSYRVTGVPNYTTPGSEPFWRNINWTNAPLAASVSPGGGHTPNLLVKSANNGFDVYMLFKWNDSAGPSFLSQTEVYRAPNGTIVPLTEEATANLTQLYYNSTYYYPDRVAVLWFIANRTQLQQSPRMVLGTGGAITGGAAEIWHWQANPTDNDVNDTGFPGGYTDPLGNPIFPPDNLSFAEDDYTNTTGFYVIGGSFGNGSANLDPYADPFMVHVGSYYSHANKTWTVEMVRTLRTSDAANYRVQLVTGSSYFIAMAVWQGKLGESAEFKSASQWYNITISDQVPHAPPSTSSPTNMLSGGVTTTLAVATAVSALIIGIVIGTVARLPSKKK